MSTVTTAIIIVLAVGKTTAASAGRHSQAIFQIRLIILGKSLTQKINVITKEATR